MIKPHADRKGQIPVLDAQCDLCWGVNGESILNCKLAATYDIDIPGHHIRNISSHISVNVSRFLMVQELKRHPSKSIKYPIILVW